MVAPVSGGGMEDGEDDMFVSLVVERPDGEAGVLEGAVTPGMLREYERAEALLQAEVSASGGVAASLPGVTVESPPVVPLFYEGTEELDSRMKQWGLHPVFGPAFKFCLGAAARIADILTASFATSRSRLVYSKFNLGLGFLCLFFAPLVYFAVTWFALDSSLVMPGVLRRVLGIVRWAVPPLCFVAGWSFLLGGLRQQQGMAFRECLREYYDPIPAFSAAPVFSIGHLLLSLKDTHVNFISFGGIGSGKTASFVNPMLLQFFRKLNNPDPFAVTARFGGLILDVKGDFIDFVIYCFRLTGRPLTDLVIIDPDIDLIRYNPLDGADRMRFADEGAEKLVTIMRLISANKGGGSKDPYWDNTSKSVIAAVLRTLQVLRETGSISLADVGRYARDDDMMEALIREATERLARDRYRLSEEEYYGYLDSVTKLRTEWVKLSDNTKSILKTTISEMLGPIVASATLQKVFCRDTNFSFRQSVTEGKVVLFRGGSLPKSTNRLLAACLKLDFQAWARRRNGGTMALYGLDKEGRDRTILYVNDEYQEMVTTGQGGDEEFFGVSRSCKVCAIMATQHVSSLYNAVGGPESQTHTLIHNLCTKVFLNSPDSKTGELGEYLGGKFLEEELRETVDRGDNILPVRGDPAGNSVAVEKKLQDSFRKDRFANLLTMDLEKSKDGPWYSEAFVYHYNSVTKGASKMFFTRLAHCYAPRNYMAELSHAYTMLLRDRNAQRQVMTSMLGLQAHAAVLRERKMLEYAEARAVAEHDLIERACPVEYRSREESSSELFARYNQEVEKAKEEMKTASPEQKKALELYRDRMFAQACKYKVDQLIVTSSRACSMFAGMLPLTNLIDGVVLQETAPPGAPDLDDPLVDSSLFEYANEVRRGLSGKPALLYRVPHGGLALSEDGTDLHSGFEDFEFPKNVRPTEEDAVDLDADYEGDEILDSWDDSRLEAGTDDSFDDEFVSDAEARVSGQASSASAMEGAAAIVSAGSKGVGHLFAGDFARGGALIKKALDSARVSGGAEPVQTASVSAAAEEKPTGSPDDSPEGEGGA
ncbi:hypothetical protein OH491_23690 [Termitidicoccus mucosus]|uniref:Uncharacterized protein n=1 Tax=Termitidicoccus mucosus TaxID=1184151 RepID=A0A178IQC3_9BACT|nr:hypothetical protein AW736_02795 [Opitutaceae bacterium TSB47]